MHVGRRCVAMPCLRLFMGHEVLCLMVGGKMSALNTAPRKSMGGVWVQSRGVMNTPLPFGG